MANPTDSRELDDLLSTTTDYYLQDVVDQVYNSNALAVRLKTKDQIIEGGAEIRQAIVYAKVAGGPYRAGQTFDTSIAKTKTQIVFNWTRYYGACNLDGLVEVVNAGPYQFIDLMETTIDEARARISDDMGNDLINSVATDDSAIAGLAAYVNDGTVGANATYGGITYATSGPGSTIKAITNVTGGPVSLSLINSVAGQITIQPTKPDLCLTTQTIYDKIWDRAQPSQRVNDPGFNDITRVGMNVININGMDIVADSHVPSGTMYLLTTDYLKLITLKGRNMVFEGWYRPFNADQRVGQVLWSGNLIGKSPRLNAVITGLT